MNDIKILLEELRVKHYIKNALVFLPLFFSLNLMNSGALQAALLTFLGFCFSSSFVYIINDIADKERDALHPQKRNRPIPSGRLSLTHAKWAAIVCLTVALAAVIVIARRHSFWASLYLVAYIAINILYSFKLKQYSIVDVACIAAGFVLRVLAGGAAIGVPVSDWLSLMIIAFSMFMGFGKRRNELRQNSGNTDTRSSLKSYSIAFLDKSMYSMMTLAIAFYTLWSIDDNVIAALGTDKLVWSTPLVIIIFLRYSQNIENDTDGDPTNIILGDKALLAAGMALAILLTVMIYL